MEKIDVTKIKEFPLHTMELNSKCIAIGSTKCGKSTLVEDTVQVYRHQFPVCGIISGSEDNNHAYSKIFPDLYIHTDYDEEILNNWEKRQKLAMADCKNPNAMYIIDDSSYDQKYMKRPVFQKWYKLGRHWKMMLWLCIQYSNDIPPTVKNNFDYAFIFRDPDDENRKKLYKNYGGITKSFNNFCDLMDQLTGDFTALVIWRTNQRSNEIEDCVFYYKARQHEDIEFGSQEYKQWSEERYNPGYVMAE